ncbi:MAG: PH domain-containing protein [Leptolinea sp.]
MNIDGIFRPPRRRGLTFQIGAALAFSSAGGIAFWYSMDQQVGLNFVGLLAASLLLLAPVPLIVYRAYALSHATYRLEREGLILRWGLRAEDIPLNSIEWVRPASELGFQLPQPRFSWPGALLGFSKARELGQIEFLASDPENLTIIATPAQIFAISPANPKAFMLAYQRTSEMGSITPMAAFSALPAAYVRQVWRDRFARLSIIFSVLLTIGLLVGVTLIIPTRVLVSIGFEPSGLPMPPMSSAKLLLLPTLSGLSTVISILTGLFYYRYAEQRLAGYLVLAGAGVTPLLLILSLIFIR